MPALSLTTDTPDLAQYYEAVSADRQFKAGRRLIGRLAIKPGARVLDVGSGTEPAGRLGISTGARDQPSTIQEVRRRVLERAAYSAVREAGDSVAHYVSADELSRLFRETGFEIEHLALEAHSTHHASAEAAIQFAQASSFGNYLGRIPEGLRAAARRDIVAELEKLRDPEGIPQHGTRIVAVARKPKASG